MSQTGNRKFLLWCCPLLGLTTSSGRQGQEWASPVHSKRPHQGMLLMATFHFFIMPQLIRYTTMSSDMTASCMGPQPRGRETSLLHTHDHSPKMACTWVRSRQDAYPGETSQAGCGKNNRGNLSTDFQRTPLSKTTRKFFFSYFILLKVS